MPPVRFRESDEIAGTHDTNEGVENHEAVHQVNLASALIDQVVGVNANTDASFHPPQQNAPNIAENQPLPPNPASQAVEEGERLANVAEEAVGPAPTLEQIEVDAQTQGETANANDQEGSAADRTGNGLQNSHVQFALLIKSAYEEVVGWRKNIFDLPKGKHGKAYVAEVTKWINEWLNKSEQREISFLAIAAMPHLLLQRTHKKAKSKEHKEAVARRLLLWKAGDISSLVREGQALQKRLASPRPKGESASDIARHFRNLIVNGNVNGALRLLDGSAGSVLPLDERTKQLLSEKHPEASAKCQEMLLNGPVIDVCPVIFDEITPELIKKLVMRMKGSGGPSQQDSSAWRRMAGTQIYGAEGTALCQAIAMLTKNLCSERVPDPESLMGLMACRLIPLDKNPGCRPIGIGEVLRRIVGKAVTTVLRSDLRGAAGALQLCVGWEGGAEAGVHALREIFSDDSTQGIIQVDAENAFNSMNRQVMLHNIEILCPEISVFIHNCYAMPARLFVGTGMELKSVEGTTQGAPESMPIYAIGIMPLLSTSLNYAVDDTLKCAAFADDLIGAGSLKTLRDWWELIVSNGKFLGYFANPGKSWLIVKEQYLVEAEHIFAGAGINVTSEGRKHLGASIGSEAFKTAFVTKKVQKWVEEVNKLAEVALTEPHVAYAAYTHGLQHKFTYLMRTIPDIRDLLKPLDDAITNQLIKNLLNRDCSELERSIFALPVKLGGLGLPEPSKECVRQYANSVSVTEELTRAIVNQDSSADFDPVVLSRKKSALRKEKETQNRDLLTALHERLSFEQKRRLDAVTQQGASNWLSAMPIKSYGFFLDKLSFRDALFIRYGIPLPNLPSRCVCGEPYNEVHALNCPRGGFISVRHNEIRDLTAELLNEVCNDVSTEPMLTPLTPVKEYDNRQRSKM